MSNEKEIQKIFPLLAIVGRVAAGAAKAGAGAARGAVSGAGRSAGRGGRGQGRGQVRGQGRGQGSGGEEESPVSYEAEDEERRKKQLAEQVDRALLINKYQSSPVIKFVDFINEEGDNFRNR